MDFKLIENPAVRPVIIECTAAADKAKRLQHAAFGLGHYPMRSTAPCMYDGESFTGRPVPVPSAYNERTKKYSVYGHFCSINCAKAYLIDMCPNMTSRNLLYFGHMVRNVFGILIPVKPAPPPLRLSKFPGGDLTIAEFRTAFTNWEGVQQPPFIPSRIDFRAREPEMILQDQEKEATKKKVEGDGSCKEEGLYAQFLRLKTEENKEKEGEKEEGKEVKKEKEGGGVKKKKKMEKKEVVEETEEEKEKKKKKKKEPKKRKVTAMPLDVTEPEPKKIKIKSLSDFIIVK